MSRKPKIVAAGAVVLRQRKGGTQVLVVHRPGHDDWSLPKGKPHADEDIAPAAVREVAEETGVTIRLGLRLSSTHHEVEGQRKVVHWWVGHVVSSRRHRSDDEVDKVRWLEVAKARKRLSYDNERAVLDEAVAAPMTGAVLLVRHGKAMLRKHWSGTDAKRPVNGRGRRQSKRLVALLGAFGVDELHSSTSTRCLQTFEPSAAILGRTIIGHGLLSEEQAEGNGDEVATLCRKMRRDAGGRAQTIAVCGHRPVLPDMQQGLGVEAHPMLTAQTLVVHVDEQGKVVRTETVKSAF